MRAEIITIGDEILIGQTIDTNSAWMAKRLNELGIFVYQITSISDQREHIIAALQEAEQRAQLVLITGGLGPTNDDITKKTLSEYFDSPLVRHPEIEAQIVRMFEARGIPVLEVNRQQADLPAACRVMENRRGTAQGMWLERNGVVFVSMPGVPYEMEGIMKEAVLPAIKHHFETPHILHFHILTQGIGESMLAHRIAEWEQSLAVENIKLAYLPSPGAVKLRLTTSGPNPNDLKERIDRKVTEFMAIAGEVVYGFNDETLEVSVGRLLREKGASLCTAESCTGGRIAAALTLVPGSSTYFKGSVVAYANEVKMNMLGVTSDVLSTKGAVSEEVVRQMAEGAKVLLHTDYAIAVSGIAGPDGGSEEKPVGTIWIAVATPERTITSKQMLRGDRERIMNRAAQVALSLLRNEILQD